MVFLTFFIGAFYASTQTLLRSILCSITPPSMQAEIFSISEISQKASALLAPILLVVFNSEVNKQPCVVGDQYVLLVILLVVGAEFFLGLPLLCCVDVLCF